MQELRGMPVVHKINEDLSDDLLALKKHNISPCLAIVRLGNNPDDLSYERGIVKRFEDKAQIKLIELDEDISQEKLEDTIAQLNIDDSVHGILVFRPLPRSLDEERIKNIISPKKDVDCMGLINNAHVFSASGQAFPPCTPQAVMELLDFYGIDIESKRLAIVGRSMVVGKPLAMLTLAKNATVTICHTKTKDIEEECKRADILIACAGVAKMINQNFTNKDQVVIDVGINVHDGKLCGDVDFDSVANHVKAITPVPGGVGTITTSVLLKHTIKAAMKTI